MMADMTELNRRWNSGLIRHHLRIRFWCRNPFSGLWRWLWSAGWWCDRPELQLRTRHDSGECYCPWGLVTDFRLQLFGVGLWGWWSRSWVPQPCHCSKVIWLLYPDDHEDDIEAYGGLAKLQAEYPGVTP